MKIVAKKKILEDIHIKVKKQGTMRGPKARGFVRNMQTKHRPLFVKNLWHWFLIGCLFVCAIASS